MLRGLLASAAGATLMALAASPAAAAWSRSYVVEWYEPALYFGSDNESTSSPGTDCPDGVNPLPDWISLLKAGGMDPALADKYADPEFRNSGNSLYAVIPNRGPDGVNIYRHPDAIPDPGLVTVSGHIAYGFDLDGDPNTGFDSPDGKTHGVDNAFYKATGCVLIFRGPPRKGLFSTYSNDGMHDGVYTMMFVLSGPGDDPMNEPEARMGVYISRDRVVKDANGQVTADYSYRINPDPKFQSLLDVRVHDGVVETTAPQRITMRDFWTPGFFPKELVLEKAQLRFAMNPDGSLSGLVGGYRDWREHFRGVSGNGSDRSGAIHENLGQFQLPGWWYALKRNADGLPDPVTGENRGISTTYSINAAPAFVVTPDASEQVTVARLFETEPQAQAEADIGDRAQR